MCFLTVRPWGMLKKILNITIIIKRLIVRGSTIHVPYQKVLDSAIMRLKQPELIIIGARIRKARENLKFSQEAFADKAEISRSHYGCIERGQFAVSLPKFIDIALALNIEIGELFPSLFELKKMRDSQ